MIVSISSSEISSVMRAPGPATEPLLCDCECFVPWFCASIFSHFSSLVFNPIVADWPVCSWSNDGWRICSKPVCCLSGFDWLEWFWSSVVWIICSSSDADWQMWCVSDANGSVCSCAVSDVSLSAGAISGVSFWVLWFSVTDVRGSMIPEGKQ